jgi:hypothetical protein
VIDESVRARLLSEQAGTVSVEDVVVRGTLFAIEDRPSERERQSFNGTLLDDSGQMWSVRFKQQDSDRARQLWKHYVQLKGSARYSMAKRPQINVEQGEISTVPSWEQALARLHGSWRDLYRGTSFEDAIRDLR